MCKEKALIYHEKATFNFVIIDTHEISPYGFKDECRIAERTIGERFSYNVIQHQKHFLRGFMFYLPEKHNCSVFYGRHCYLQ